LFHRIHGTARLATIAFWVTTIGVSMSKIDLSCTPFPYINLTEQGLFQDWTINTCNQKLAHCTTPEDDVAKVHPRY
jgi:hypothetical protein